MPERTRRGWFFPTIREYQRSMLQADVLGGLTASAVILPQAMAYATIAGLPVQIGLYTCMLPAVVYALLGGSRALNVSTTSTIATLTASSLLAASTAAESAEPVRDLVTLTLIVGVLLILARLFRLGSLVENVSEATLIGIRAGTGLTIAATQLPKLLGIAAPPSGTGFFETLGYTVAHLVGANGATVVLSAASIALLLLIARFFARIPGALIVVVVGIVLMAFTGLAGAGVALIAPVPSGLPGIQLPDVAAFGAVLPSAIAIAIMAFLESISAGRSVRTSDEPDIDADQELLALGAASVISSFTQAMPAGGGFSQAAVSRQAGVRTQVASLTTAVIAVLVALFLAPVLSDLPQAVLGSLVIVAAVGLVKVRDFTRLARISPVEAWLALATAVVAVTAGLLAGVVTGVLITLVLVLRELNQPQVAPIYRRASGAWSIVSQPGDQPPLAAVLPLHLTSGLYTANIKPTTRAVVSAVQALTPMPAIVIFEVASLPHMSVTVLDGLRDLEASLVGLGCTLYLVGLPERAVDAACNSEWFAGFEGAGHLQPTIDAALKAAGRLT
ncbi:SulP family inorganic anion transporter [Subtercola lobariae]|uniref:SulP family inorganic anion transporter n=1 Tax=Subtercola lobariae TaxID=1588641 RepID=UPI001E5A79CB|nr:SulP family inorganic anion transporter [Subtercola lobariae]